MCDPVELLDRDLAATRADKTICVVDDSESVRDSLRVLLEAEGFAVRDFASGASFLEAGPTLFGDCVIVDLVMPVMSGVDVIEAVRGGGCQVPIIVVTGHSSAISARGAATAFAVIDKPFAADVLVRAVLDALGAEVNHGSH